MADDFTVFETHFLGPRDSDAWREGPALHLLDRLQPGDKARAARALHTRLEDHARPNGRALASTMSRGMDDWSAVMRTAKVACRTPSPRLV
jgi:hypothetical protein